MEIPIYQHVALGDVRFASRTIYVGCAKLVALRVSATADSTAVLATAGFRFRTFI